ncbi:MAG TPA: hypothetical protein VEL07_04355 [Planctomycetota bacterium]|nr:hypothetical protein [Planctomycetota bacterium]
MSPATRAFLALPAGPAIAFLVSAACLLGGAGMVIGPSLVEPERLAPCFAAHTALIAYWLALAAVALLIERWRRANPDGVGVLVLIALIAVAATVSLDVIAVRAPRAALACGLGGLALAAGMRWLLAGRVLATGTPTLGAGLALVLAGDALMPGVIGWRAEAHLDQHLAWRAGWMAMLAGLATLAVATTRFRPERERDLPCVRRDGMRWVLALVVLAASAAHQWSLDHIHDLGLAWRDWLPAAAVTALILGQLRSRIWGGHGADVVATAVAPAWALIAAWRADDAHWLAPWDLVAVGALTAWLGVRTRSVALIHGALAAGVVAAATGDGAAFDPLRGMLAAALALAGDAIARREPRQALVALLLAGSACAPIAAANGWTSPLASGSWLAIGTGLAVSAFAWAWPKRFAGFAMLGGAALIAGALRLDPWPMNPLAGPSCALVLVALACRSAASMSCCRWRCRRRSWASASPTTSAAGLRLSPRSRCSPSARCGRANARAVSRPPDASMAPREARRAHRRRPVGPVHGRAVRAADVPPRRGRREAAAAPRDRRAVEQQGRRHRHLSGREEGRGGALGRRRRKAQPPGIRRPRRLPGAAVPAAAAARTCRPPPSSGDAARSRPWSWSAPTRAWATSASRRR